MLKPQSERPRLEKLKRLEKNQVKIEESCQKTKETEEMSIDEHNTTNFSDFQNFDTIDYQI